MIYDICTFNGEREMWEIRYNVLQNFVDEFRVIEFDKTFSGKPKKSVFNQNWPKVKHYFVTEDIWSKYWEAAKQSPNTEYGKGAEHWIREWCMKEAIRDCLIDLKDDDLCWLGDVDEIIDVNQFGIDLPTFQKYKLKVYSYYLNNSSNEEFWGPIFLPYWAVKDGCLNHFRSKLPKTIKTFGFHFTSIGSSENIKKKLTDSYTKDSYANDWVLDNLEENISNNKDFLGRNFTYKIDEESWPAYLKDNKDKYKHLCK